jgi:hypothetical protein
MSRPPRVSYIEHPSRHDSDAVQHGHSIFTCRPEEFVFSPGDFTGRGVPRKWPRSAVRGFHAEVVGSRTSSLPRGRLLMSLHDGTVVELVPGAPMAGVVVLAQRLEDLRNGVRTRPEDTSPAAAESLRRDGVPEVTTERSECLTVIIIRLKPDTEIGHIRFEVDPTTLSMFPRRRPFGGEPRAVKWKRAHIVDVTVTQRLDRRGRPCSLQLHFARGTQAYAIEDCMSDAQIHPVMVALRGALELPTRAEAARRWLGVSPSASRPGDATSPGDVLPYAPEPQDKPWLERTPGLFRAFFPRENPSDIVYSFPAVLFAAVSTIFAVAIVAEWTISTVRIGLPFAVGFFALAVSGAGVLPLIKRCLEYRTIEVAEDARLVLSVRSPFQNTRRTWDVEEIREIILHAGYPRSVSVRLAKRKVELAGFRKRADAEAFADTLSLALGFATKPTRV